GRRAADHVAVRGGDPVPGRVLAGGQLVDLGAHGGALDHGICGRPVGAVVRGGHGDRRERLVDLLVARERHLLQRVLYGCAVGGRGGEQHRVRRCGGRDEDRGGHGGATEEPDGECRGREPGSHEAHSGLDAEAREDVLVDAVELAGDGGVHLTTARGGRILRGLDGGAQVR